MFFRRHMKPVLLFVIFAIGAAAQASAPPVPATATPEEAPLPGKVKGKSSNTNSELGSVTSTEDGVMSLARYQGGSWTLKPAKVSTYVNHTEIVLRESKQRFAIPVKGVTEVSYGGAVSPRVAQAAGIAALAAGGKNKEADGPTTVGIVWKTAAGTNGVVLKVDKGDFDGCMSALQSVTGLQPVNTGTKGR